MLYGDEGTTAIYKYWQRALDRMNQFLLAFLRQKVGRGEETNIIRYIYMVRTKQDVKRPTNWDLYPSSQFLNYVKSSNRLGDIIPNFFSKNN